MADRVKPYSPGINYWLFATDPAEYSYDRLERIPPPSGTASPTTST